VYVLIVQILDSWRSMLRSGHTFSLGRNTGSARLRQVFNFWVIKRHYVKLNTSTESSDRMIVIDEF
jgi:hypothetical protein